MAAAIAQRRLQKELKELCSNPPPGVIMENCDSIKRWVVGIQGAKGTLYEGENFKLQFSFGSEYPIESPEVIFIGNSIPIHPHIYSNGHICLSILYDGWTPALSTSSVCISILSMLSSCPRKERPPGNDRYVESSRGKSPKLTHWGFDDDTV